MKKTLAIAEARALFESKKVFATEDGFIFNDFGKYCPNLTFVVDASFELDKDGKVVNPIQYISDREITDSFNLDLGGEAEILFGDFWRSKKDSPCFRPKDPRQAKDILVRVNWGGAFNGSRGFFGDGVKDCGATYFRCASSNGGGTGYDYWVVPVGYVHQHGTNVYRIDWEAAREYCGRISEMLKSQRLEADRLYKAKLLAEEESKHNRDKFAPRLEEIGRELEELREHSWSADKLTLGEVSFSLGYRQYLLYTPENLALAEKNLAEEKARLEKLRVQKLERQRRHEEFSLKFKALEARAEAAGFTINVDNCQQAVLSYGGEQILQKDYSYDGLEAFEAKIHAREQELEKQRLAAAKLQAEAEAKELGLPSNIRIWKRTGGRTGCSKGWVIKPEGVTRERDELFNENSRRAQRYDEGYEIWRQILPGELVICWSKSCTAANHEFEVCYQPKSLTDAQLEKVVEIQNGIEKEWEGLTGLASGKESPSIGEGWMAMLVGD